MALENATTISQLVPANPSGADLSGRGDDHIRMIKRILKSDFGSLAGPLTVTADQINAIPSMALPAGVMMLWIGTEAPAGWAICDGRMADLLDGSASFQTPDMRDRVPIGASGSNPLGSTTGQASRTVTTGAAGGHTPTGTVDIPGGNVSISGKTGTSTTGVTLSTQTQRPENEQHQVTVLSQVSLNDPGHDHEFSGSATISGSTQTVKMDAVPAHGHSATVDVRQPSFALNFIIKL